MRNLFLLLLLPAPIVPFLFAAAGRAAAVKMCFGQIFYYDSAPDSWKQNAFYLAKSQLNCRLELLMQQQKFNKYLLLHKKVGGGGGGFPWFPNKFPQAALLID